MINLMKESFIYKIYIWLLNAVSKMLSGSFLWGVFTKEVNNEERDNNTIFVKLLNKIIEVLRKVFAKLKLNILLDNSIFAKPMIWLTFTVFLIPFLPTMVDLALVFITFISLCLKILMNPDFKLKYLKTNVWILIFALIVLISAVTSITIVESLKIGLLITAFTLFYFTVINTVENKKQLVFLLYVFIVSATISAIYGLYQYAFGDLYSQAWLDKEMFESIKMRVYSTFENPNVYGEYLILVLPIMVALFWNEKNWFKKLFILGMFGITMIALILTFSRGCYLGILLALVMLMLMIDKRFISLIIIGLILLPFIMPQTIIDRFMSIGNMGDSSTSYRVYIWLGTIAMLKDYFLTGIGLGITSFNTIYPIYSYNNVIAPHSHNLFLQMIVEYGITGFIVFMIILYNFYKECTISMIKDKNIIIASIISGMTGFFLQSMFDNTWYNYRVILIFWMVIAFGLVATKFEKEK